MIKKIIIQNKKPSSHFTCDLKKERSGNGDIINTRASQLAIIGQPLGYYWMLTG